MRLIIVCLLVVGCSDSSPLPPPPDMSGGWAAVVGCLPTDCADRMWAKARVDPDGKTRYVVTDTLFNGNGTVSTKRVGLLSLNVNHVVIEFDVSGTGFQTWRMSGDFTAPDYSQFSVLESWRYTTGQSASQGPWTFRRIP